MTEIIDGKIIHNELTKNAMGGTELVAHRIIKYVPQEALQGFQIISTRVRELHEDKKIILHCHDMDTDPESQVLTDPTFRKKLSKIVFVSHWQAERFIQRFGLSYDELVIIYNPIEPFEELKTRSKDNIKFIYHTTPHRGLELLVPAFYEIAKDDKDITLDVYSSFAAYGWNSRDERYSNVFEACRQHPQINYHGFQPNQVVREALLDAHVFAYPCIWPETSCLALIEAIAAGCAVVHPAYGALVETSKGLSTVYNQSQNAEKIIERITNCMRLYIKYFRQGGNLLPERQKMMHHHHDIKNIAPIWTNLLTELKNS